MEKYLKTVVAVLTAGLLALQLALTDGGMTTEEWVAVAIAVVGALGVYAIPNRSDEVRPDLSVQDPGQ